MSDKQENATAVELAKIERDQAEAEYLRQQAATETHRAEYQRLITDTQRNQAGYSARQIAFNEASDYEHRIYHLMGPIEDGVVHDCMEHLTRWARMDDSKPVGIKLNTLGGYAHAGMALFDEIRALRGQGLEVTITVRGTAASMGAILLQAASKRVMGPSSTLMLHKIQAGAGGSLDQIEDMTAWFKIMQDQVYDIFADRCAESAAPKPLTRRQIVLGMNRKDWSLGPAECLELGLIDEIG